MGSTSPFKDHHHHHQQQSYPITKKLLPWVLYALLPLALFRLYLHPLDFSSENQVLITSDLQNKPIHASTAPKPVEEVSNDCDYSNGEWVQDKLGPLYNGTTCGTIKDGQNCMGHGRPDSGYLYWRWKPSQCKLPRFEPTKFLSLLQNKHLAFVGDSMARNQLESLLCLLSSVSPPDLVYTNGDDNKFRRWHFSSHNVNVSIYWSPFLVKGVEKSNTGFNFNKLFLDSVDDRWASDLEQIDMLVLSAGHWFLHPAVYYENNSVIGCHACEGLNHSEIGFFDVLRKAVRTSLKAITDKSTTHGNEIGVILTTFSPAHFEGEWDKNGACSREKPFEEGEKALEGMDADMRKIEVEEIEEAKNKVTQLDRLRFQALDVTKLAFMRPDGHPGPYMYPNPFAGGVKDRVQNDCVHWCLPGPIDTWNQILLQVMRQWEAESSRRRG